jgi:hypothetical protein
VETSSETAKPMTKEEMYDQAMGVRSGYRRGFGHGKKGFTKRICLPAPIDEEHEREVNELKDTVAALEEKVTNFEAKRKEEEEEMRREIREQIKEEIRQMLLKDPMSFPTFHFTESEG